MFATCHCDHVSSTARRLPSWPNLDKTNTIDGSRQYSAIILTAIGICFSSPNFSCDCGSGNAWIHPRQPQSGKIMRLPQLGLPLFREIAVVYKDCLSPCIKEVSLSLNHCHCHELRRHSLYSIHSLILLFSSSCDRFRAVLVQHVDHPTSSTYIDFLFFDRSTPQPRPWHSPRQSPHSQTCFGTTSLNSFRFRSLDRKSGSFSFVRRLSLANSSLQVGIVSNRQSAADWDADMQRAKAYGIDAFALNIGVDSFTDTQLGYAYTSAQNNGMKVFLSFDFNWWSTGNPTAVGQKIAQYASQPAQLMVDNAVFVSTFVGDGLNVATMRSAAGVPVKFVPNYHPNLTPDFSSLDGAFNWMGWPNNGQNRAPASGQTGTVEAGDQSYINALNGKDYLAPASPWFFTHYGPEVSYSKNWLFPGDTLWYDRWTELLTLGPRYVEIVSWNDYGESHYVGPLNSQHTDDGASKWVNDMPHDAWLDMSKPFIAAFKAGATKVDNYITSDQVFYWYRPQLKSSNCDSTDSCGGAPDGYQTVADSVFVVTLLKSAGTIQISSGTWAGSYAVSAGATMTTFPLQVGQQSFTLSRSGQTVLSGTSLKNVISGCVCGEYNFNAYVGMLPSSGTPPALNAAGLASFTVGLKVATCTATPSLGSTSTSASTSTTSTSTRTAMTPSTTSTWTRASVFVPSARTSSSSSSSSSPSPLPPRRSTTTAPPASTSSAVCNSGYGSDNYGGLCSFCCNYGYCPSGPCTCSSYGAQNPPPPTTNVNGVPANGLDSSYAGLCNYACSHGYCPSSACQAA